MGNKVEQLNNIVIINKPARHAPTPREKKLIKKFKNHVKELFKKLFTLLMR